MRKEKGRLTIKQYADAPLTRPIGRSESFGTEKDIMYYVKNKDNEDLGDIEYYKDWKCWIFEPEISIIFSADCLREIVKFLDELHMKG